MDIIIIIAGILLCLAGLAGSVLPFLPGPPLAYAGLLMQQLRTHKPFSAEFLWLWAFIVVVSVVMDYVIPAVSTKLSGGSKYGVWGCTIGLIAGFWLGPLGIILGPLAGAFIGELIFSNNHHQAIRAALGSFAGFLFGTLLKIILCFLMGWYLVASI